MGWRGNGRVLIWDGRKRKGEGERWKEKMEGGDRREREEGRKGERENEEKKRKEGGKGR